MPMNQQHSVEEGFHAARVATGQGWAQVDATDIMEAFLDVQMETLDQVILPRLLEEGTLQRTANADRSTVSHLDSLPLPVPGQNLDARWLQCCAHFD